MKKQLVLVNLLLLSLGFLFVPNTQAQECPKVSNTRSTAYIQREGDKRCEGVRNITDIDKFFSLISFTVGRITTLPDTLQLAVPSINQKMPKVRLLSFPKNYQLDTLDLSKKGNQYQFKWSNFVLKSENIDPNSLRATAYISTGKKVYLPIILNPGAGEYNIVLNSDNRVSIAEFKILRNNQVIYTTSRPNFQPKGQIYFTWNGRSKDGKIAPEGFYELRVSGKQEQDEAPPQSVSLNITFAHNPQWLK